MGLAVSVAMLADLDRHDPEGARWLRLGIEQLNSVLRAAGQPAHVEPAELSPHLLPHVASFPYAWLHFLRRAYAHTRPGAPPFTPAPPDFDPASDELIDAELTLHMDSHLCCHSDADGYYVPIDLPEPIYGEIAGGIVGSSVALLAELTRIAPLLDIPVVDGRITEATATTLAEAHELTPLYRERIVWGALFATATASVRDGTLLVFH